MLASIIMRELNASSFRLEDVTERFFTGRPEGSTKIDPSTSTREWTRITYSQDISLPDVEKVPEETLARIQEAIASCLRKTSSAHGSVLTEEILRRGVCSAQTCQTASSKKPSTESSPYSYGSIQTVPVYEEPTRPFDAFGPMGLSAYGLKVWKTPNYYRDISSVVV